MQMLSPPSGERIRHRKRRLTSPPSSQLLAPLSNNSIRSASHGPCRSRVKDQREAVRARDDEIELDSERERECAERANRFGARWRWLRALYASVTEFARSQRSIRPSLAGKLSPMAVNSPSASNSSAGVTMWVRDLAIECRRAFADPLVTFPQLETAFRKALHLNSALFSPTSSVSSSKATVNALLQSLRAVFRAFAANMHLKADGKEEKADYRDVLNALIMLEKWRDGERRLLTLWFDEFSHFADRTTPVFRVIDCFRILSTASEGEQDEAIIRSIVVDLFVAIGAPIGTDGSQAAGLVVSETRFAAFVDSHPTLLKQIKFQCWKRLTDDTRLAFYRDLYVNARERFHKEEARVRFERAVALWRSREPRARWARWVQFVADRKLLEQGDKRFYACSGAKMLRRMRANVRRRVEMRTWTQQARRCREVALKRWAFAPWRVFYVSSLHIHAAAARRSDRSRRQALLSRFFLVITAFYQAAKERHAEQRARVAALVATREGKALQAHWCEWEGFYRRRKEVAAADKRQRALLGSLSDLARQQDELAKMGVEDAISAAVETALRKAAEEEIRRSFQQQTEMLLASRRMRQQEEARVQFKRERERVQQEAASLAWSRIADQVAAEVRTSTLEWQSDSIEGEEAVHEEATRIFEQDPKVLLQHFLAHEDPRVFMEIPARCRWQLRLEDVYGSELRLSKPYFTNTQTNQKFLCEELVMEDCTNIASEVIVARRIGEALERVREKQSQQQLDARRRSSAMKIQAMARIRRARKTARALIRARFVRRIEPRTGGVVYFDIYSQREHEKPPLLAGSDVDACIPVESTTWTHRLDNNGRNYYLMVDAAPESEPTWSWGPPDHYAMCERCRFSFASRRHTATGERVCVVCYAEQRHRSVRRRKAAGGRDQGEDGDWGKVAAQPVSCVVCRNALAVAICRACRGDATCARCHQAVHNKLKKCSHDASFEPLVARTE